MDNLVNTYNRYKREYDDGKPNFDTLRKVIAVAMDLLSKERQEEYQHTDKNYFIFYSEVQKSRPVLRDLYYSDFNEYNKELSALVNNIDPKNKTINIDEHVINKVIYTSLIAFSCSYDLYKNSSRKTPGTFFEIIIGHIMTLLLPGYTRDKQISIPNAEEKITTDIVFDNGKRGIAIPVKITTRERIVQPFAHQRIIEGVFGEKRYKSVFVGASETKRGDKAKKVDDICVPGTIKLFSNYLAPLAGLYYLDPPARYLKKDVQDVIKVSTIGRLLKKDLHTLTS